jgi:hypothetical protein
VVAEGFEPDSGARVGGKGLSDDALGTRMPGHTPRLPLKADLGFPKRFPSPQLVQGALALAGHGMHLQGGCG